MRDRRLKIELITPAPPQSRTGNRVTAMRWARLLRRLGHDVILAEEYKGENRDALIALHARRSSPSVDAFHQRYPERPIVVALTGTDLYEDLKSSSEAARSVELASALVVLQDKAPEALRPHLRSKAYVIYQSVERSSRVIQKSRRFFDVAVVAHLREVKDPFRAAEASRLLPGSSRIRIRQVGKALDERLSTRAREEEATNRRYHWLGEVSRRRAREVLVRSRLSVLSSRIEGGANAVSESLAAGVPVLASRIPGNVGMLGEDYAGYFAVGDTEALARLLSAAETNRTFYGGLVRACRRRGALISPERETRAWRNLLRQLVKRSE